MHALIQNLQQILSNTGYTKFVVGFSGGLDSTVLLHALTVVAKSDKSDIQFRAVHIDHGLQTDSAFWAKHCQRICGQWQIELRVVRAELDASGSAIEERARNARYQIFTDELEQDEALLLAHHQDDQVETVLFRLARGTGVHGLAGIPENRSIAHSQLFRPLLAFSRSSLEAYAKEYDLRWVDDPTNAADEFSRNYIRHNIVPAFTQRWPEFKQRVSELANKAEKNSGLLNDLAKLDLGEGCNQSGHGFPLQRMLCLSEERIINGLCYWLQLNALTIPETSQLQEFVRQLSNSESHLTELRQNNFSIRRYREQLFIHRPQSLNCGHWQSLEKDYAIDETRCLGVEAKDSGGLRRPLNSEKVTIGKRPKLEKFHPAYRDKSTTLKKAFQEAGVPSWLRDELVYVFYNDALVSVVGWFENKDFLATPSADGIVFILKPKY